MVYTGDYITHLPCPDHTIQIFQTSGRYPAKMYENMVHWLDDETPDDYEGCSPYGYADDGDVKKMMEDEIRPVVGLVDEELDQRIESHAEHSRAQSPSRDGVMK